MTQKKFPCETCIALPICKARATFLDEINEGPITKLYTMCYKCKILEEYVAIDQDHKRYRIAIKTLDKIQEFFFR
jgi:hypothetical protein